MLGDGDSGEGAGFGDKTPVKNPTPVTLHGDADYTDIKADEDGPLIGSGGKGDSGRGPSMYYGLGQDDTMGIGLTGGGEADVNVPSQPGTDGPANANQNEE